MEKKYKILKRLLDLLFPLQCPFCRRLISRREFQNGICTECEKTVCLYPDGGAGSTGRISAVPYCAKVYCAGAYAGPMKQALIHYKFQGGCWMAEPFASAAHLILSKNGGYHACDWIAYVPIHKKRFAKRGYDQSKLIAEKLSHKAGIPLLHALNRMDKRAGDTMQSKRGRYARLDQKQRFSERTDIPQVRDRGILLVDDILTTGATLNECAEILMKNGAAFVNAFVLASGRRDL